ncbi:MAG: response regulator [Gemmatimonadales bacterium]
MDDVRVTRRVASRYLSDAGYRVFEAESAQEALELLDILYGQVDLVLTDVVIPRFDGVRLGREVGRSWPGIRILYMSAYSGRVLGEYGMDTADMDFIAKPFTETVLLAKIAEVMKRPKLPATDMVGD